MADFNLLPRLQRKHMESGLTTPLVETDRLGPGERTFSPSQSLHALLPHPLLCQMLVNGSHKKVSTQVVSHTKISNLTREPWLPH